MKINAYYSLAIPLGFYLYALQQGIFYLRFNRLNTNFTVPDFGFIVLGILSVALLIFLLVRLPGFKAKAAIILAFVVAIPFSLIGSLGGGLLGFYGVVAYGLFPFVVIMLVGYFLARRFKPKSAHHEPNLHNQQSA